MKELLTLKEAAALAGRTTKTIKNYIKQGKITNYFLVDGKYGQEYRINLKDIEPLRRKGGKETAKGTGDCHGKKSEPADVYGFSEDHITPEDIYDRPEYRFLLRRNDELVMELGRFRDRVEKAEEENLRLRQELEEKNMLIAMLSKK